MIFISTPMYGGFCQAPYFESCLALQEQLIRGDMPAEWHIIRNESLIQRARNTAMMRFLKSDADKLLFIDGDIQFNPEDVAKLWNSNQKVVGGAYARKKEGEVAKAWVKGKEVEITTLQGLTEVDYLGTGFLMIDRSVFEEMIMAYPSTLHRSNEGDCYALFDCVIDEVYLSEDYTFCKRWKDLGNSIYLDPTISLKHWGMTSYG